MKGGGGGGVGDGGVGDGGGGKGGVQESKQLESDLAPPYQILSHPTSTREQINLNGRRLKKEF